jgi:hypothetical protein
MFSLAAAQVIDLASPWGKRSSVFPTNAKQNQFGYVAEIEANSATV